MSKAIEKITDLVYNELVTLRLIEKNSDLLELFYSESNIKFPMIYKLQAEGKLNQNVIEITKMIFNSLIVTKTEFIDRYKQLEGTLNDEPMMYEIPQELITTNACGDIPIEKTKVEVVEEKQKPTKKENALPRRYGKENILKDIEKQGGTATSVQRAALSVNRLKNIYVNLDKRLIKDMLLDETLLTVEDYRVITATIEMLETKLKPILKKK